ncbi:hypothetical protein HDU81_010157 [Chytriomyces hyalinus]|nr:hypothetical protein HDU81_010157 [Chytriomyces hyalinus]
MAATTGAEGALFHFNSDLTQLGKRLGNKEGNFSSNSDLTLDSDFLLDDVDPLKRDFKDQIRNQNDQIQLYCKQLKKQRRQMKDQMKQQFLHHGHHLLQPSFLVPPVPHTHPSGPMHPAHPMPPRPPTHPVEARKPFNFRVENASFKFPAPPTPTTETPFNFGPSTPPPFEFRPSA